MSYGILRTDESLEMSLRGQLVEVSWVRVTEWDYDKNACCDADGNRGREEFSYDDSDPEDIVVTDEGNEGMALSPEEIVEVLKHIEAHQSQEPPDWPEDDDEPDCDDRGD
jgi:hypothetical protein